MPNKQAPHPRRATQGTTATCVPCAHRCTGVQQRETESSSGLQGDVSKANQQETPNFFVTGTVMFFFHSDCSSVSQFQAFAKHESQLVVFFCLDSHSSSRVLLN